MPSKDEIARNFTYHPPPNSGVADTHERIRERCRELADELNNTLPESRECSMAIRRLEETMMWANACVARWPNDLYSNDQAD